MALLLAATWLDFAVRQTELRISVWPQLKTPILRRIGVVLDALGGREKKEKSDRGRGDDRTHMEARRPAVAMWAQQASSESRPSARSRSFASCCPVHSANRHSFFLKRQLTKSQYDFILHQALSVQAVDPPQG